MQRHKFARAFKITSFFALMFITVLLTGTLYAAPKVGPVTPENSIIGQYATDHIGYAGHVGVYSLPNGNIVIVSRNWNDGRGAVTCLTPNEYRSGGIVVSAANSLVGGEPSDAVGLRGITVLSNGNFVVSSPSWNDGSYAYGNMGAVTWVNGNTCIPYGESTRGAMVSPANSLVGTGIYDKLGDLDAPVVALTNGNYVVPYPKWEGDGEFRGGAVRWVNGATGTAGEFNETNSLVGLDTSFSDNIGSGGVTPLTNGNYVVSSPQYHNDEIGVGAVTWGDGWNGTVGVVSAANSLVGSTFGDSIGDAEGAPSVTPLPNGNYVVTSHFWHNGSAFNVGAVTWGNGNGGTVGVVSAANSLVGSQTNDRVGYNERVGADEWISSITVLQNSNYVVNSSYWRNGTVGQAGAVTWGNGNGGTVGVVSALNSLVGSSSGDRVGFRYGIGVIALSNGNYVVGSTLWDNGAATDAGAVTWGDGNGGTVGIISAANSLVGSSIDNEIGSGFNGVTPLNNGNYVVNSPGWNNGASSDAGAVTWGDGNGGTVGAVSAANSLIGSSSNDLVGNNGVTVLTNGNYVVNSPDWDNGTKQNAGAVTWGSGSTGIVGVINAVNSLVGTKNNDAVGSYGVTPLTNDNYVVASPSWANGTLWYAGAVTWGNGTSGTVGTINSANSLVGSAVSSGVGSKVTALSNGNYVVSSSSWRPQGTVAFGAVTWGDGDGGTVGVVNAANSLIGTSANDYLGSRVTALSNGHYVVTSPLWNNGAKVDVGAVTWGNGSGGTVGQVSPANSLIGSSKDDIGRPDSAGDPTYYKVVALDNGHYVVIAPEWDNGTAVDAGAIIVGDGFNGIVGTISASNALVETFASAKLGRTVKLLNDNSFVVNQSSWDNGLIENVGAITWSDTTPRPNNAPVLTEIGDQIVDDGETLSFYVESSDSDAPARPPVYSITNGPEGAAIDPTTGAFLWTAGEDDGGQVFNVTVTVTDNGTPALSDSESFTITVNEVNDAPVLAEIGNQTVDVGGLVLFDAEAVDVDEPAQTLMFSITGAPEDANFDTATGEFSWTAGEEDDGQSFNVTVTVTDDGEPALSDSEIFTIAVNPVIVETNYLPNASFENPGTTNKTAQGWNGIGLTNNDKRICDTDTKTYALDGECAYRFQFNGATAPARTLQRHLNAKNFAKNDVVELRGMVKANGLTDGARFIVKVVYNNGKTVSVNVKLTAGSYDYAPFTKQIMLKRPVTKITMQIKAGSAKGTFFVDDMAVVKVEAAPITPEYDDAAPDMRGMN